jgi:hypothetical protein
VDGIGHHDDGQRPRATHRADPAPRAPGLNRPTQSPPSPPPPKLVTIGQLNRDGGHQAPKPRCSTRIPPTGPRWPICAIKGQRYNYL